MKTLFENPKPPLALFTQRDDGIRQEHCYACGECGVVARDKALAEDCCKKAHCETCGAETYKHWTYCSLCMDKIKWDKAQEIQEHDGPVFWQQADRWFDSYDAAIEHFEEMLEDEDEEQNIPEFLNPCIRQEFPGLDIESAIESMCDKMWEDAQDHLCGLEQLEDAVKKFNEKNVHLKPWESDYKRKIKVILLKPTEGQGDL